MPRPRVSVPHAEFHDRCVRHDDLSAQVGSIQPRLQRAIAELMMIRLFDQFQEALGGVAARLACGATYGDGTPPKLLAPAAVSTTQAVNLFKSYGRTRAKEPKWSKANFIRETTQFVIDPTDTFLHGCEAHAAIIGEMQAVRNKIAHNNGNARRAFETVVQKRYGASLNHVTPGILLLSPRFSPRLLDQYIAACRIIVKDSARV